jgi:tRNA(Ile)-lysidine synthase
VAPLGPAADGVIVILDARLQRRISAPIVVALSGGGDSLALLLMAKAWADGAGRRLIAATLDHRLQSVGADWARWCADRAAALGIEHRILAWEGPKPATGLPAAARGARHALLADLARRQGAGVILMGHTADDALEAAAMRAAGSTTPSPREWGPSPAWPEGRGVFILRPLLACRRADLRAWLTARGETWIEDPANTDPRYARARARAGLEGALPSPLRGRAGDGGVSANVPDVARRGRDLVDGGGADTPTPDPSPQGGGEMRPTCSVSGGALVFERAALDRHTLSAALLSASGGVRPPPGPAVDRLIERLSARDAFTATLAGAKICTTDDRIVIARESGEFRRRGAPKLALSPGETTVWDGRFALFTDESGLAVRPLGGLAARLCASETKALQGVPALARAALPAVVDGAGRVSCPILAQGGPVRAESLVVARFLAAAGAIAQEETLWRVAKADRTS